jgi:hypothetical protein
LDSLVVVSASDSRSLRKALSLTVGESFSWAYLGQSLEEFTRVKHCFLGRGDQIDTACSIHSTAESLRGPYLTYLYDIGRRLNNLRWWLTSLSYRSVYQSETFLQACLLKVGLDLLRGWEGLKPLVLVVAEGPVRRAVQLNGPYPKAKRVEFIGFPGLGPLDPAFAMLNFARVLARRVYFVVSEWRRMIQSRRVVRQPYIPYEPSTLLMSSVSPRNAQLGTEFHTFFFGDLAYKLGELGSRVALMPQVLREVPYKETLKQLMKAPFPVCVPHRYLKFFDPLTAATKTIAKPPAPQPTPPLTDMNISPLVEAELRRYWIGNRAAHDLLFASSVRRLVDSGSDINRIIYVYENQPWERALCWQARRSLPAARLVGYQHSRAPRMLLNMYLAPGGEKEAPLPDRVVTVGEYTARLFSSDGYDSGMVRSGGAFQQLGNHAPASAASRSQVPEDGPSVLAAPSMGREEAKELVDVVIGMFGEVDGVRVVIKCHPTMPFSMITRTANWQLPAHVEVSEEPIDELMDKSSVMIYTGSTVCIQALNKGLPMVHLCRQFGLDLDPLELEPEARLDAMGLEDLRDKVCWLLDHREEYIDSHQERWNCLLSQMFGPVTEQTYLAFVD